MAGQSTERRDILKLLSYASIAANFPGFSRWAYGGQEHASHPAAPAQIRPATYTPQFLGAREYSMIERLSDLIIPADDTPGALAAGVPEFIDFMLAHDIEIQYPFRTGLVWLDAHADRLLGKRFLELPAQEQVVLLRPLAYSKEFRPGEEDGRAFFQLVRRYVVIGYYTSRTGMEQIGCPSLRTYSESPGCPHENDPEHKNLGAPTA